MIKNLTKPEFNASFSRPGDWVQALVTSPNAPLHIKEDVVLVQVSDNYFVIYRRNDPEHHYRMIQKPLDIWLDEMWKTLNVPSIKTDIRTGQTTPPLSRCHIPDVTVELLDKYTTKVSIDVTPNSGFEIIDCTFTVKEETTGRLRHQKTAAKETISKYIEPISECTVTSLEGYDCARSIYVKIAKY